VSETWNPDLPENDFADLDSFGGEYKPQAAFRPNLETLPNGEYDCEVVEATLDKINNDRIIRVALRVGPGRVVEHLYWLNKQEGINRLGAELCVLGFDADRWGPAYNRPLSVELPKVVAKLKGMKFRAAKTSRKDNRPGYQDRVYHDLHISCRLDGRPMPPLAPPAAPTPAAAAAVPTGSDDEIPF
jgi:hypothetical protein